MLFLSNGKMLRIPWRLIDGRAMQVDEIVDAFQDGMRQRGVVLTGARTVDILRDRILTTASDEIGAAQEGDDKERLIRQARDAGFLFAAQSSGRTNFSRSIGSPEQPVELDAGMFLYTAKGICPLWPIC